MIRYVYVSGPYSHGSQADNVREAVRVADQLLSLRLFPYCPHLSHFWHYAMPRDYEDWLTLDLAWLERSDAVLRLPGLSPGADRECARARELGKPVFDRVSAVVAAAVKPC